jgi:hypothetical protein
MDLLLARATGLGDRGEFRLGDNIAKRFAFLVPRRFKPVEATAVAAVPVRAAVADEPGVRVLESREIGGGQGVLPPLRAAS